MTGDELIKINLMPSGTPAPRGKSGFGLLSCLVLLLLLAVLAYAGWLGYQEFSRVSTGDGAGDSSGTAATGEDAAGAEAKSMAQTEPGIDSDQSAATGMGTKSESGAAPEDTQQQDTPAGPWVGAQSAKEEQNTGDEPATEELAGQPDAEAAPILADRFQPLADELSRCLEEMRLAMDVGNYPAAAAIGIKVLEALAEVGEMPVILQQFVDEIVWLRGMALQIQEREDDKRRNVAFDLLPIRLEGVIWSPEKSLAFVNGTTLAVGDPVPGLEVVPPPIVEEIGRDRVRFHYRGNTFEKKVELFGE